MVLNMKHYQSQFMESYIADLWKAITKLAVVLKENGISFTIIGGAARNQYGMVSITEDVDIVVAKSDKEKMKHLPIGHMKELSKGRAKVFSLHDPKTKVEVIYEGEISGDGIHGLKYDNPKSISKNIKGIPFITLEKLIEYKLSSGIYGNRLKDFADIVGLIKKNKLSIEYANTFRDDLKEKYIELWGQAHKQIDEI